MQASQVWLPTLRSVLAGVLSLPIVWRDIPVARGGNLLPCRRLMLWRITATLHYLI